MHVQIALSLLPFWRGLAEALVPGFVDHPLLSFLSHLGNLLDIMNVYFVETVISLGKTFQVIGPLVLLKVWCSCCRRCLARVNKVFA